MARPVQFERDQVLDQAMHAFWDQGYCATSMSQLVHATGLNPGSIYAAFKSKEGIFLAALDHYGEASVERIRRSINSADNPLDGIRSYFRQLAATAADPGAKRSCFLVNTVLELANQNDKVQQRINHHFAAIEACFAEALTAAYDAGELPPDKDPAALAAFLIASIWGLRVLGATNPSTARADAVVTQVLQLLE